MKRRFNFTGRRRIPRERISINLNKSGESVESFSATIDLNGIDLLSNAKVYLDAYHRTERRRYNFGTVENIVPPQNTGLATLAYGENLKFQLLVVDESEHYGLILAHADKLKPESGADKKPILPVDFRDLGQQIWKVEYSEDENAPLLLLNTKIQNIQNIAKSDPQFIMFTYPAVFREVLIHMVFVEGVASSTDPPIDWHRDWLQFAQRILPGESLPESLNPEDGNFEKERVKLWIDRVIEEFCASRNEWGEYINRSTGEIR